MQAAFIQRFGYIGWRHLLVVDSDVPYAKGRARRGSNDPGRFEFANHPPSIFAVLNFGEVPMLPVRSEGPEV